MTDSASHSESAESDADHPLVLSARLERAEEYTPGWTSLLSPVQTFISLLPSHKNTRKGRRTARQLKILIAGVAFGVIIFAESIWATILGAIFLGLSPWLPLPQVQKRAWINRLKKLREPRERSVETPAEVTCDDRRIVLRRGDDNLRRVLIDRDEHEVCVAQIDDRLYLRVAPLSGRKSETIWVGTDDLTASDLPDDWDIETFTSDATDAPTLVDGANWRRLAEHLQ